MAEKENSITETSAKYFFVRLNVLSSTDGFNDAHEFLQNAHYLEKNVRGRECG
jgi:hypothetical protein